MNIIDLTKIFDKVNLKVTDLEGNEIKNIDTNTLTDILNEMKYIETKVNIKLTDENGNIKKDDTFTNLIVNNGKYGILEQLMASPTISKPSHMALGTNSTATSATDTALGAEIVGGGYTRVALTSTRTNNQISFVGVFGQGNGTAVLREAGIFTGLTGGNMYARTVFGIYDKAATDIITINWTWILT